MRKSKIFNFIFTFCMLMFASIIFVACSNNPPQGNGELTQAQIEALIPKEIQFTNGMYMTNVIGSLVGKYSQNLKDIVLTLKQCFQYVYVFKAMENTEHEQNQNFVVIGMDEKVHFNIVSYRNINQKRYHQGMINHVDDIDYTNGHILRDKNLL